MSVTDSALDVLHRNLAMRAARLVEGLDLAPRDEDGCGDRYCSCSCARPPHDGDVHRCRCLGSWRRLDAVRCQSITWPQVVQYDEDDWSASCFPSARMESGPVVYRRSS